MFKFIKVKIFNISFLFICLVFVLTFYWLKSSSDINFSNKYSLSKTFPFNYLQRDIILENPQPGLLFTNDFDSFLNFINRGNLWMRQQGDVFYDFNSEGFRDSRCLLIRNAGDKSWSFSQFKFIEVQKGDVFSFSAYVKLKGKSNIAFVGFSAFDDQIEPISWNYVKEQVDARNRWIAVRDTFLIVDDIKYIKFRFSGLGKGESRFDNVRIEKIK